MTDHILSLALGVLGGFLPGTFHLAWKLRRGRRSISGSIDLSAYRTKGPQL